MAFLDRIRLEGQTYNLVQNPARFIPPPTVGSGYA
jgi:hypothetical protein